MYWENWPVYYARLSEDFFNLFCAVFIAYEMYQLTENEKLKFPSRKTEVLQFQLNGVKKSRISVKIRVPLEFAT